MIVNMHPSLGYVIGGVFLDKWYYIGYPCRWFGIAMASGIDNELNVLGN